MIQSRWANNLRQQARRGLHVRHATSLKMACERLETRMLLTAGDLDLTFSSDGKTTMPLGAGASITANDVAVQSDGKIVVVGYNNTADFAVARFNVDGSPDTTFGPTFSGVLFTTTMDGHEAVGAYGVAIQTDGKIVVAGTAFAPSGAAHIRFAVARYLSDGAPDPEFDGNGVQVTGFGETRDAAFGHDVLIQNDGKIVLAGSAEIGDDYDFAVVRYNVNGSEDSSFDGDGKRTIGFGDDDVADAVAIDYGGTPQINPNYGDIVVVGDTSGSISQLAVARLNTNGSLDSGFSGDGKQSLRYRNGYNYSVATGVVADNGSYVVAGKVGFNENDTNLGALRLLTDGSVDNSFGGVGDGRLEIDLGRTDEAAETVIVGQTGKLLIGGGSGGQMVLLCLNSNGTLDPFFNGDGIVTTPFSGITTSANGLARAPGGKFVAAGGGTFATARYYDRSVTVSIGSFDPNASEPGADTASLLVARVERLPTPTRVFLNTSGTATPPNTIPIRPRDYQGKDTGEGQQIFFGNGLTGSTYVDIPADKTFVFVTIEAVDDTRVEGDETAIFNVTPTTLYDVGTNPSTTLAIRDNDLAGAAPAISSSAFVYDSGAPHRVRFTFNQSVASSVSASDFSVTGASGAVPFSFVYDDISNTATLNFSGTLPDGNYSARAISAGITNAAGAPMAADLNLPFFFLQADANHDRNVDVLDLGVLATHWQGTNKNFSQADFNYDTKVDVLDLGILATNWQKTLAAPGAALGRAAQAAVAPAAVEPPARTGRRVDDFAALAAVILA